MFNAKIPKKKSKKPSAKPTKNVNPQSNQTSPLMLQRAIESPSASTLTPAVIQDLQRQHGNAFVNRLVQRSQETSQTDSTTIQRMPERTDITSQHGEASTKKYVVGKKRGKRKQGNYHGILDAIDDFHNYRNDLNIRAGESAESVDITLSNLIFHYSKVIDAISTFLKGKSGGKKAVRSDAKAREAYFRSLLPQLEQEKEAVATGQAKLVQILASMQDQNVDRANLQAQYGGGMNKVYKYAEGFFKKNHTKGVSPEEAELYFEGTLRPINQMLDEANEKVRKHENGENPLTPEDYNQAKSDVTRITEMSEAVGDKYQTMKTNADVFEMAGIDPQDAHTANREVAMSRLDQLLGTNMITKAEFALEQNGVQTEEGVLMEAAQGTAFTELGDQGKDDVVGLEEEIFIGSRRAQELGLPDGTKYITQAVGEGKEAQGQGKMYINDPNFMRQLSRLQLIDTIAMQIDRNISNFFVVLDDSGNVVDLKGIDNDMAMGTNDNINQKAQEYPGLAKYVDKELAQKIMALDPQFIRFAMSDLLTAPELDALESRITQLQEVLKQMEKEDRLLEPEQWNDAIAKEMLEEGQSYFRTAYESKLKQKTA